MARTASSPSALPRRPPPPTGRAAVSSGSPARRGTSGGDEHASGVQSSAVNESTRESARNAATAAPDGFARPPCRRAKSSRTGMRFDPLLPIDGWKMLGAKIAFYSEATTWWLGDWLLFGEIRYGRRYREGIALTGLDYKTLRNYAVVARRFEPSRRRPHLSFQHHAEVCALPDDVQDSWLDLAVDSRWSKTELRRRVRASAMDTCASAPGTTLHLLVEVHRDERWRAAANRSGCALEVWMTKSLDAAADAALDEHL